MFSGYLDSKDLGLWDLGMEMTVHQDAMPYHTDDAKIWCGISTSAARSRYLQPTHRQVNHGKFSKFQNCFCGLDPGNLKFETVRTHKQHMFF